MACFGEEDLQPSQFFGPEREGLLVKLKLPVFGGGVSIHELEVSVVPSMWFVGIACHPGKAVAALQPLDQCEQSPAILQGVFAYSRFSWQAVFLQEYVVRRQVEGAIFVL